jgi:hypothetical protein
VVDPRRLRVGLPFRGSGFIPLSIRMSDLISLPFRGSDTSLGSSSWIVGIADVFVNLPESTTLVNARCYVLISSADQNPVSPRKSLVGGSFNRAWIRFAP